MDSDAETPVGRLPDFLIIGAPRAGTTALHSYLREHRQVFVSDPKELHFFDRGAITDDRLQRYRSKFAAAGTDRVAGEATPTYLHSDVAIARLARTISQAKLIVTVRNPVDRAYSHYWQACLYRVENRSFAEAVGDELGTGHPDGGPYLTPGRYVQHLERVCHYFPRSSILVVLFDDLRRDPQEVFSRVCRHIGVDDTVRPPNLGRRINPNHNVHSLVLWRAATPWRARTGWRKAVAQFVDARNIYSSPPPPMNPNVREELVHHYRGYNRALSEWIGRDLSFWDGTSSDNPPRHLD